MADSPLFQKKRFVIQRSREGTMEAAFLGVDGCCVERVLLLVYKIISIAEANALRKNL
jgi:hypothetical protein